MTQLLRLEASHTSSPQALQRWAELEIDLLLPQDALECTRAYETAALQLRSLVHPEELSGGALDDADEDTDASGTLPAARLDELAERCRTAVSCDASGWQPGSLQQRSDQLTNLAQVIRGELGFKMLPYEWLYEGLAPMLLPDLLRTKKGNELSLAMLYCCVARRLHIPLTPLPAPLLDMGRHLPEMLQSSLATAPAPDQWLLRPEGVVTREGSGNFFLDPVSGKLLSSDECLLQHPTLQQDAPWGPKAILRVWADSCRLAMVAHQRRGDADAVAHCLYQVLALDGQAPEWGTALQPPAIAPAF